jgi:glycosyltransferase involved in cell wall biosynthesis
MKRNSLDAKECIVYTFWFDRAVLGASLAKRDLSIHVVSRAHGHDVYEERQKWAYIPCRGITLQLIDKLFPVSDALTQYLVERYPTCATKVETIHLGVFDSQFITAHSKDGILRIASCSFLIPRKRVDLLIKGISEAAKLRPHQSFEWNHTGTGPMQESLQTLANKTLPSNVKFKFRGYTSANDLMQFY